MSREEDGTELESALNSVRLAFAKELRMVQKFYEEKMRSLGQEKDIVIQRLMEGNSKLMHEKTVLEEEYRTLRRRLEAREEISLAKDVEIQDRDHPEDETRKLKSVSSPTNQLRLDDIMNRLSFVEPQRETNHHQTGEQKTYKKKTPESNTSSKKPHITKQQRLYEFLMENSAHADLLAEIDRSLSSPSVVNMHREQQGGSPVSLRKGFHTTAKPWEEGHFTPTASPFSQHSQNQQLLRMQTNNVSPISRRSDANRNGEFGSPLSITPKKRTPTTTSANDLTQSGRNFFRDARGFLSEDSFDFLLRNMKQLNQGKQNRETTMSNAQEIFGSTPKGRELYHTFQKLLQGQVP